MRKKILIGCMALLLCLVPISEVKAGTITASGVSVVCVQEGYQYYATGYTTSTSKHYTNVHLENGLGLVTATSGRQWGTGRVTATTEMCKTAIACRNYTGHVYYGF